MRTLKGQLNSSFARTSRPGSALILVVVLTVLLSVVGVMFMMVSRIGEMSASSMGDVMALDTGVDVIVRRIEKVLVDDIVGADGFLLNNDNSDEYWDYPGINDPWLASLEPIYDGTNYIWPHVTDLYDDDFGLGVAVPPYHDPDDDTDDTQWDPGSGYEVSAYNVISRILYPDTRVSVITEDGDWAVNADVEYMGARADADGDGVADSRWFVIPHVTGSNGEDLYAAVRIIDNSGMININTAYRDPTLSAITPGDWDGSLLTHVNLEGIRATTEVHSIYDLNALRYDGDPAFPVPDDIYHDDVARRLLNPVMGYLPFDLSDELDLRNRYFLSSSANTRCSNEFWRGWNVTFKPDDNRVGKTQLYYPGDKLDNWYAKLKPDVDHPFLSSTYINTPNLPIGFYNRRFFSTTLNLDRTMVPWVGVNPVPPTVTPAVVMSGELKTAWNLWTNWNNANQSNWTYRPVCVNDYATVAPALAPSMLQLRQLAAAIWLGLPKGSVINAMPQFIGFGWADETAPIDEARQRLACMMAVNLVDYMDDDNVVTTLVITDPASGSNEHYYGHESAGDQLYITRIAVAQYDDGLSTRINYGIEVYNPSDIPIPDLSNWVLKINNGASVALPAESVAARTSVVIATDKGSIYGFDDPANKLASFAFAVGSTIELIHNQATGAVVFDRITVPADPLAPSPTELRDHTGSIPPKLEIYYAEREIAEPDTHYLLKLDDNEATMPILPDNLFWSPSGANPLPAYSLTGIPADTPGPQIQLEVADAELKTIGELTNVLAVGMMVVKNAGGNITAHYNMPKFFNQIKTQTTDLEPATPKVAAGRIDLMKPEFADIFRYLTVFNPAGDGVDNDGSGLIDDNPAGDGIDNDYDGFIDAADPELNETFANFGIRELAVAGRININTAPWFVMAQLPWMKHHTATDPINPSGVYERSQAIVNDRIANGTYEDIADVMRVAEMGSLAGDTVQNSNAVSPPTPDFTDDGFTDDLEERDLIFQRISNLVTVRSDLLTAYILVRLDVDGPQKRMIAIFDRSRVFSPTDRPRLIALHPVPDPR